ncbi:starch synthase [Marchantia polymorpha subsp. ruderalis]|uniref:starch synthase n=1 Tax=Marchantia polymorpha TaxID=3197 RepID=A0A2R6WV92_MARPO|nr:hypothetical protein MARPO_0055s0049 [Marchantia polymorpha]BBN03016.1 hypothetical protein Mp_2g20000 [Marchantia polymorpha subsp. ruderalis]|eukprot:PTQ37772.1 hypothetical protein MARPO_0055s0049 [Marchantia polymorpha]
MASSVKFPTPALNQIFNAGGSNCSVTPGSLQLRGGSIFPVRYLAPISAGANCDRSCTGSLRNGSFRRSNAGQPSARPRRKTGDPKLKKAAVAKEFSGSLQPLSGATANVQDRRQEVPSEGSTVNDAISHEDRLGTETFASVRDVQSGTIEQVLVIGGDAEPGNVEQVLHVEAGSTGAGQKHVDETSRSTLTVADVEEKKEEIDDEKSGDELSWAEVEPLLAEETSKERAVREQEEKRAQEEMRRSQILKLAVKHSYLKNKIFYYPNPALATEELEIFINRRITALIGQPKIFITGAFNDWRWKPFTTELTKTSLPGDPGDWWACKIHVPKEAYKVDFIFYDGLSIYENNDQTDFFIMVDGGMSKVEFEYFLLEEKAEEARRRKEDQAKKERIAAEERELAERKAGEEADRAQAKAIVNDEREMARSSLLKAVERVDGLWFIEPSKFGGGESVTLFYNRASGPLSQSKEVWIHGGYNNWKEVVSVVQELSFQNSNGGDWWAAKVKVPEKAYMLNWVFADGPPETARLYDNNDYRDFHGVVTNTLAEDAYWGQFEEEVYEKLQKERQARREEAERKAVHIEKLKKEMAAKTMETFLQAQSHIFYTKPAEPLAGEDVTVYYNPSNTVLNGKPDVYMRGSFNRWTHFLGCFEPIKMVKAENGTHLEATVKIPKDAYVMDFVFSERGDDRGGIYDNRNGLDYHVPVKGGLLSQPPLDIIHIAVEMAPIAKVGGLGDVVTSLARAVQESGHNTEIILPKYDCLNYKYIQDLQEVQAFHFGGSKVRVWNGKVEGLTVHFLEPENGMFWAGCIYGRRDDGARFGFFCHSALEFLRQSGKHVDIIHCHDWSSAPVAWLFNEGYRLNNMHDSRIVFSIHNLEFGAPLIGRAMANAHMATTVSPTYAAEVAGNGVIAPHLHKFHGIRNGIDPEIWDPYTDPFIPVAYTTESVTEGKRAAKEELRRRLGLRQDDRPMLGIITRLTAQKGIALIKHGIYRTLERGGQVVLLGSAPDPRVQNEFVNLSNQLNQSHGDMARLCLSYDEPLSHLIYAGSDFILIPSIFEPCGLTQLTAMRYGAIPVVRKTGGLNDTVFDVDHDKERARAQGLAVNGFSFEAPDAAGLDYALNRAISAWYEARDWFQDLCKQVMQQDWTWNRPALDYIELYYGAKKKP